MRGLAGFRKIHIAARAASAALALVSTAALASTAGAGQGAQTLPRWPAGRHIPRGELSPQVVEKAFDSPRGEVQFTVVEASGNRSGYLRNNKGNVMAFTEVRGGRDCEEWFESPKTAPTPRGCEFLFYDQVEGRYLSVRGDEMEENSLFDVTSDTLHAHLLGPQSRLLLPGSGAPGAENGGTRVPL